MFPREKTPGTEWFRAFIIKPYLRGSGGHHAPRRVQGRALPAGGISFVTWIR